MKGYYRLRGRRDPVAVSRVFGAVANYGAPLSDEPIIFLKPPSSIIHDGAAIHVPAGVAGPGDRLTVRLPGLVEASFTVA